MIDVHQQHSHHHHLEPIIQQTLPVYLKAHEPIRSVWTFDLSSYVAVKLVVRFQCT